MARVSATLSTSAAFAAAVAVTCALHWPLPLGLGDLVTTSAFHDGHVWCFDYIARMVTGEVPWTHTTREIGYPETVGLRFIAWVPALAVLPLRPFLGPVGAYYAAVLLSPGAVAAVTTLLLRKATGGERIADDWVAAGASLIFALCPFMLGCMASGQIAKMQLWLLPLYLLALIAALAGRKLAFLALALASAAASFSSPTLTLQIPLVAGVWVLGATILAGRRWWRIGLLGALALGITATSLLPARSYYGSLRGSRLLQAFEPGVSPSPGIIPDPAPMAQPEQILDGRIQYDSNPRITSHVPYLGWPLLIVCALVSVRRSPARIPGWVGAALGVTIALGPKLASKGRYLTNDDGMNYALPAKILEITHYPISESGMYYRAIAVASLGLAAVVAGGLGRIRGPWGALLAWGIAAGVVYDGYRISGPLWPRPVHEISGRAALEAMGEDPVEGVVIDMPIETDVHGGDRYLLNRVIHRRPTQGLPRQNRRMQLPHLQNLHARIQKALKLQEPDAARAYLAERGYRYAIWNPGVQNDWIPYDELRAGLGEPEVDGELAFWRLDLPEEEGEE